VVTGDAKAGKLDKIIHKEDDVTVCLPGATMEDVTRKSRTGDG